MRIIITLMALMAVAAIASGAASTEPDYAEFDPPKTAITVKSPTCLQAEPNDDEEAVICYTKGTEVTIVGKFSEKVKIDGKSSYWYKVDLGDGEDYYVFGSYIEFK